MQVVITINTIVIVTIIIVVIVSTIITITIFIQCIIKLASCLAFFRGNEAMDQQGLHPNTRLLIRQRRRCPRAEATPGDTIESTPASS